MEWAQGSVTLFVYGAAYRAFTAASVPAGAQWVFDRPFFIQLNLAIGGPTTLLGTPAAGTPRISPDGIVNAASGLGQASPGALATFYRVNLSGATYSGAPFQSGSFVTSTPSRVAVGVNGADAPLTYVSLTQINFQIP